MTINIGGLPPPVTKRYNQKYALTKELSTVHTMAADRSGIDSNEGIIDVQSRYNRLQTFENPIDTAHNNPPNQALDRVDIQCRIKTYATWMTLAEEVTISNQDPVLNKSTDLLAQASRETRDILQRTVLESAATVINCDGGENGDMPTEMGATDVSQTVAFLQNNSGQYITDQLDASDGQGTTPGGQAYLVALSTRMIPVLNKIPEFARQFRYGIPTQKLTKDTEWGSYDNARFFVSELGSVSPRSSLLGQDVANCFFQAYASHKYVVHKNYDGEVIYHGKGHGDDPAELRHTLAAKFRQGEAIKDDEWLAVVKSSGIGISI